MDINWATVLLQLIAARFRMPARLALLGAAWVFHTMAGASDAPTVPELAAAEATIQLEDQLPEFSVVQSRDEYVLLGHAAARLIVHTRVLIRWAHADGPRQ
jgi:hypothetical protein